MVARYITEGERIATLLNSLTFEQVRPHLKLSKSEPIDNGPYTTKWDADGWWEIFDRNGVLVGQSATLYISK